MSHDLAIIIPAYKPDFLRQTLESVLSQTDQRFTLYIFDDASPHNLSQIVHDFDLPENARYHRFEENAGQASLVKQWNRCIELIHDEKWVWLFSDDDVMSPGCVRKFYKEREIYQDTKCFRFDTEKIDADGKQIRVNKFPKTMNASEFLNLKLSSEQESYVVEYIFSRKAFHEVGGFPELPLAWASDDLFWAKMAALNPIRTIKGPDVKWRYSSVNISGGKKNSHAVPKLKASRMLVDWIKKHPDIEQHLHPADLHIYWFARQIRSQQDKLTLFDELTAVIKMSMKDLRILKHYYNIKKEKSRLIGWLKYKFNRSDST